MDSKSFKKKYKTEEYAIAVVCDLLFQQSIREGREATFYTFSQFTNKRYILFRSGLSIFKLDDTFILVIVYNESELHVKKLYREIYLHTNVKQVVFLCLDDITRKNKNDKYRVYGFSIISGLLDSYKPKLLSYLINKVIDDEIPIESKNIPPVETNQYKEHKSQARLKSDAFKMEFADFVQNHSKKCTFIIGNGVSIPFGADSWETLVMNLIDYLSPFYISHQDKIINTLSKSNYLISSFVKNSLDDKHHSDIYYAGLRYCIYRKYHPEMLESNSLIKAIALAKIKYQNLKLYTYNYDRFIEHQIEKEDPSFSPISISSSSRKKDVDRGVFHLHGFIEERDKKKKSVIVLTEKDYFNHYFSKRSWTYRLQLDALKNNFCLFIGSSMSDLFQLSIIENAYKDKGENWFCYALLCFKGLDEDEQNELLNFYYKKHIKVIYVDEYDQLIETLNTITNISFKSPVVTKD